MVRWFVEFEGREKPLDEVWSEEMARIVGPTRESITAVLEGAGNPGDLEGLRVIVYAEDDRWGFKFAGPPLAVNYAVDLVGQTREIGPRVN